VALVTLLFVGAGCSVSGSASAKAKVGPAAPAAAEPTKTATEPADPDAPKLDVSVTNFAGEAVSIDSHLRDTTVIAMWASYCGSCRRELPHIEALAKFYRDDQSVNVLLVAIDDLGDGVGERLESIYADSSITMPKLVDDDRSLFRKIAQRDRDGEPRFAVPMIVVLDRNMRLRRVTGAVMDSAGALRTEVGPLVAAALRGEPPPPDPPYDPSFGTAITKRSVTLESSNLTSHEIHHLLGDLRDQFERKYPDLSKSQLTNLMRAVAAGLRAGGKFTVDLPLTSGN